MRAIKYCGGSLEYKKKKKNSKLGRNVNSTGTAAIDNTDKWTNSPESTDDFSTATANATNRRVGFLGSFQVVWLVGNY